MTTEIITRFVEARPFIRFEMVTTDGRILRVPHSDFATLERHASAVTLFNENGQAEIVDSALIVSIRTLDPLL